MGLDKKAKYTEAGPPRDPGDDTELDPASGTVWRDCCAWCNEVGLVGLELVESVEREALDAEVARVLADDWRAHHGYGANDPIPVYALGVWIVARALAAVADDEHKGASS